MVTLLDYCNDANGVRCNRHGYKWLHWLQAESRYNRSAKQGHLFWKIKGQPHEDRPDLARGQHQKSQVALNQKNPDYQVRLTMRMEKQSQVI